MHDRGDEYVLERTQAEYQRLRLQSALWEETTRRVLVRAGLCEGMRCLDVACGPGEVMRLMAEMTGPSGQVTGVDIDGALGRQAVETVTAQSDTAVSFVEAGIESIEDMPGAPFDLTYARLILMHVADPVALLRKMYAWTRPGGVIVVQDYDTLCIGVHPEPPSWQEFMGTCYSVFTAGGRDPRLGVSIPRLFEEAGIGTPQGTEGAVLFRPLAQMHGLFQGMYRSLLPVSLALGITTEERARLFLDQIDAAEASGAYFATSPLLLSAWRTR